MRTTSMPSATRLSSEGSAPVKRTKVSRSAVSTVTRQPRAANRFAVASAR
jgi:hypothetical protein